MDIASLVTKVIGVDAIFRWFSGKLKEDYGISDIEVKRLSDSVVLVIKGDNSNLDKVEKDLRVAVAGLKFGDVRKVEVKLDG